MRAESASDSWAERLADLAKQSLVLKEASRMEQISSGSQALKYDDNKQRYDLLPAQALDELVSVYSMGAKKYADNNWRKGLAYSRVFAAIMRHAWAWYRGEDTDSESGLHHMAHAAWGCLALVEYSKYQISEDDRQ